MPDTMFALSSGQPPAAIAIIRISGPAAGSVLEVLAGSIPPVRQAKLVSLHDPQGLLLDRALALFFSGPNSATGEDLAELHLHGGRAVVAAVERAIANCPDVRRAEPGEFTRRAFENGRLDLAEAEGLADLLTAETEGQRRNAMALADGELSRAVRRWQDQLTSLAAALEARIDFSDEDDVPDDDGMAAKAVVAIGDEIAAVLTAPPAERLRDGIRVVVAGPANAGKSTLFNRLVGRDVAIATPIPGTTRDLIEYPVQIGGLAFVFIDTAGLRNTSDIVEQMGVDRAHLAIECADIILWLGEYGASPSPERSIDIFPRSDEVRTELANPLQLAVSSKSGEGLQDLISLIVSRGTTLLPKEGELALVARQREALKLCYESLDLSGYCRDIILIAESIRAARHALDILTGAGGVEDMLDALFGRFCIGK